MKQYAWTLLLAGALTVLSGCAARHKHSLNFDPKEPLRVAVLPFYQLDEKGEVINSKPTLFFVTNLPGLEVNEDDPPAEVLQEIVQNELGRTGFDLVPPRYVEAQLVHHQFTKDRTYDYEKILATATKPLGQLLSADALLFGELTEWDRSYYGLQSVSSVGLKVMLVRAADGKVLFEGSASDSDSRGISKGPTGYSSLVLEPILGLDTEIINDLGQKVARDALSPLFVENRPEFLSSSAPAIYASAHDAQEQTIKREEPLTVVMYGTRGKSASFSVGNRVENVPMVERDPGHYIGQYFPLVTESFGEQPVYVSLTDEFGRTTRQRIGFSPVALR